MKPLENQLNGHLFLVKIEGHGTQNRMNKLAMNKLARQYINSDRFAKEDESSRL
jgi:hypothetical protein